MSRRSPKAKRLRNPGPSVDRCGYPFRPIQSIPVNTLLNSIYIKDFRSFQGVHDVPIAPLTLPAGENSTGKSTFLAPTRLALDLGARYGNLDFNEPPFGMGSFGVMAFFHGGAEIRSSDFEIGGSIYITDEQYQSLPVKHRSIRTIHYSARFDRYAGRPGLFGFSAHSDYNNIIIHMKVDSTSNGSLKPFKIESTVDQKTESFALEINNPHTYGISEIPNLMMMHNLSYYYSEAIRKESRIFDGI